MYKVARGERIRPEVSNSPRSNSLPRCRGSFVRDTTPSGGVKAAIRISLYRGEVYATR